MRCNGRREGGLVLHQDHSRRILVVLVAIAIAVVVDDRDSERERPADRGRDRRDIDVGERHQLLGRMHHDATAGLLECGEFLGGSRRGCGRTTMFTVSASGASARSQPSTNSLERGIFELGRPGGILVGRKGNEHQQPPRIETEPIEQFFPPLRALAVDAVERVVHRAARERELVVPELRAFGRSTCVARLSTQMALAWPLLRIHGVGISARTNFNARMAGTGSRSSFRPSNS